MVFPSNAAWQAWNEYLATDSNIPEMFSTIAHMDAKVWGQPSHKSLQGIAAWGAMPNVVVSATSSAIAVAGRPDVEQAIQQIVEVAFPTPEGLQEMIDAFNDPEIMGMLQAAGCTWVFFETGAPAYPAGYTQHRLLSLSPSPSPSLCVCLCLFEDAILKCPPPAMQAPTPA